MGEITIAILKQHHIIDKNLMDFDNSPEEDVHKMKKLFDAFRWNLNKHMFIEEENLFPIADRANPKEMTQLKNLLKDHKDIRAIIANLIDEVAEEKKPNVKILQSLLGAHEAREIQSFYPLLDRRLPAEAKRIVLNSLKDVRIG